MQINTLNPDGSGTRGGPLPASSAAPKGAAYSGLLECPCTTRVVKDLNKSTINGRPFHPHCTADAWRSDLLATHNPTCALATYVGGMECCHDGNVLLDREQTQPEYAAARLASHVLLLFYLLTSHLFSSLASHLAPLCSSPLISHPLSPPASSRAHSHEDEIFFKWRFYHEPYAPARHTPLVHLEWAVNGCDSGGPQTNPRNCAHIEYDAVKAPKGTPPDEAVHTVTSHFQFGEMLAPAERDCDRVLDEYCASERTARERGGRMKLLMAGGHCHSPACIALELWNADSGELLCRVTPRMGEGDMVWDEAGYVWLPPCMWGEGDDALLPPPVLALDANLTSVKVANATHYHYGVMGIWQMRGAYMDV